MYCPNCKHEMSTTDIDVDYFTGKGYFCEKCAKTFRIEEV